MKRATNSRRQLDDWRASFWRRVVWVNQVLPGTVTLSVADLKAMSMAERMAFFDAVEEVAAELAAQTKPEKRGGDD